MTATIIQEEEIVKQEVPKAFIIEVLDGVPLYYRGYKSIIDTPSKVEEIMGAGGIHSILLDFFYSLLVQYLDNKKYWRYSGEAGLKIEKNNIFNLDLAVYLKEKMPSRAITKHVASVPPELVIEIDTSIEYDGITHDEYVFKKTQQLLQFGTRKVVWVFSATNRVMIAEPDAPWLVHPWSATLPLMDGISFNIETYCRENELDNLLNP